MVTRRLFFKNSGIVVGSAAFASGLGSCGIGSLLYSSGNIPVIDGPAEINLEHEEMLQPVGGSVKKRFKNVNNGSVLLIIHTGVNVFAAYAAQCTHWGAEVGNPVEGIMTCPFHGSQFSSQHGFVLKGPAEDPLPRFDVTFDELKQTITIRENAL